jgi:predicted phage tail protein
VPLAPGALVSAVDGSTVRLAWTAPLAAGPSVIAYIVEAGSRSGAADLAQVVTDGALPLLIASGVANGTYYVRVRASNAAGAGPPSNEVIVIVGGGPSSCAGAPSAPRPLEATVAGSTVLLGWGAAAGQAALYVLEAGSRSEASDLVVSDVGAATSITAVNVAAGTYFVRVRARNSCGVSAPSNEVVVSVR